MAHSSPGVQVWYTLRACGRISGFDRNSIKLQQNFADTKVATIFVSRLEYWNNASDEQWNMHNPSRGLKIELIKRKIKRKQIIIHKTAYLDWITQNWMNDKQIHQKKRIWLFLSSFLNILSLFPTELKWEKNKTFPTAVISNQIRHWPVSRPRPRRLRVVSALVIIRSKPRHPSGRGIIWHPECQICW